VELQQVIELSFSLKRFSSATYVTEKSGISFAKTLLFVITENISTDRLIVSDEAVRVINQRE
jgi:hypothetical protein